jgi:hypothetical protein
VASSAGMKLESVTKFGWNTFKVLKSSRLHIRKCISVVREKKQESYIMATKGACA